MADIYRDTMDGICVRIAMQSIRKLLRGKGTEKEKLDEIICVVHEYEYDTKETK